jgi:putative toxin-antitoxin system antitoxin component (TIGR02293 family)
MLRHLSFLIMQTEDIEIQEKLNKEVRMLLKHAYAEQQTFNWLYQKIDHLTFDEFLSNKMLIVFSIREGISYSFFNLIKEVSPFNEIYWADLLDISTKSLHRYKKASKPFKPSHSEKIIEMAEVTQLGLEVFGNMDKLKLWLETPSYALGNLKPMELMKDSYGKEMVISELTRINYGILA